MAFNPVTNPNPDVSPARNGGAVMSQLTDLFEEDDDNWGGRIAAAPLVM